MSVGIDCMSVYVPKLFLDLNKEFLASRELEKEKLKRVVGIEHMAVADANEDAATLAASSILKLIHQNRIEPEEIGMIYIGTESGVDESKAMAGYVVGMLEKVLGEGTLEDCGSAEFKFACIGTTYALDAAVNWIKSGRNESKSAIVVASDIARYEMHSAGEYTQGAGSVAMLVTGNPRLLEIENVGAMFTKDEADFFRPVGRKTAVFDSKLSINCYLNSMKHVMVNYARNAVRKGIIAPKSGETVSDYVDYAIFHIPYPQMAEFASAFIFRHEWRETPRWQGIVADIGEEPKMSDFADEKEYLKADNEFRKKFTAHPMFRKCFQEKVEPSIVLSRQVGNIYTGSLYLGLASLLEVEHRAGKNLAGKRIGFGSYGSGCSAAAFSGIVRPRYVEVVKEFNNIEELAQRKEIDLATYEKLHKGELKEPILKEPGFRLREITSEGYRIYDYWGLQEV